MSSTYKTKVNKKFEFEFTEEDIYKIDIVTNSDSNYHLIQNNTSYHTEILRSDFNSRNYEVKINNNTYQIEVANQLDLKIAAMGFSIGGSKQVHAIKAPMPGLLLDIQVTIGQEVKEDDPLLILEAMKMENNILSPRDGVIKSIAANTGDAVDKGQLLIEFE
ncbi:acetyl-CoA carboxylase biotin carboxyl carrier protein subunit [Aquimarina longa]|uniref:acetyl-CoA carboxylase biotin carboxyl carrier protein subunit n=1 Tax=Aquimarina longa TaxID=1080221 RepID=UPI000783C37A|nr:acetyl-CoA carboxylase biotin carboxyl carrier protein subunit [Aquimarina longa]